MSNDLCKKCFFYGEPRCSYQYNVKRDVDICKYFKAIPQTLFQKITQSPEVLAPRFVFNWSGFLLGDERYFSLLTRQWYSTFEEAIAATVAKLMEVYNG